MSGSTARYVRLNSLDAISALHLPSPSSSSRAPLAVLRQLASSPRHLAVLAAVLFGLVLLLASGRSGGTAYGLAWGAGRFGAERAYSKLLQTALKVSWKDQMQPGQTYLTGMFFGGQSNQLLAMYNLLFLGKQLGRTVILPPFTAIHFTSGARRPANQIYDLPRLFAEADVSAIPLSYFKSPIVENNQRDVVTCWSTMELYTGTVNNHQVETGFNAHEVYTNFWAMPRIPRSSGGEVIQIDPIISFLRNRTAQLEWVDQTRREILPQKSLPKDVDPATVDKEKNLKPFFDPLHFSPPTDDDQITCVDATFYVGDSVPPPPYPQHIPLEPWRGRAWKEVGRHLHFIPEVQEVADEYLLRIFGVKRVEDVPPYISVHVRRGDFKNFHGNTFTPLSNYAASVSDIRRQLQDRLDNPRSKAEREGKPALKRFSTPPSEYAVLVTSDEEGGSEMWKEVEALGWKRLDHTALKTVEVHGEWWPSMLDGELLARGQGFVGTQWSTFSMVSGLRVEYWRGGIQVVANPK
ncbi:hypothetical protein JCM8097_004194 [Rhodosporidiobolus ruineniae]